MLERTSYRNDKTGILDYESRDIFNSDEGSYTQMVGSSDPVHRGRRPKISYADLITEAIESSTEGMLTLKEIYSYISSKHPYFSLKKSGWQNSIRHNLSLNKSFYKIPRTPVNPGKGSFWRINYELHGNRVSHKSCKQKGKNSTYDRLYSDRDVESISEILCGRRGFLDNIGVTEMPLKKHVTTVFDGNLTILGDYSDHGNQRSEYFDCSEDVSQNTNYIFSFK